MVEFVYKIVNDLSPTYINDIVKLSENVYNLRHVQQLCMPTFNRISYGKNRLGYKSSIIWNALDNKIKSANNLSQLKLILHDWKGPLCNCGFCIQCRSKNI